MTGKFSRTCPFLFWGAGSRKSSRLGPPGYCSGSGDLRISTVIEKSFRYIALQAEAGCRTPSQGLHYPIGPHLEDLTMVLRIGPGSDDFVLTFITIMEARSAGRCPEIVNSPLSRKSKSFYGDRQKGVSSLLALW